MDKHGKIKSDVSAWYTKAEDVKDIAPAARQFLESYSQIPPEEVVPHVLRLRDEAFALYPWPCIGQLRFIRFSLASYACYPRILELLRSDPSARLLDVGCCFGQDLRKLVQDGITQKQLAGMDLVPEFNALGKGLFRDGDRWEVEFFARDVHDDEADWTPLEGKFDVLHLTSFLHIWDWAGQVEAAKRLVSLVKPGKKGCLLVGSGLGSGVGGEFLNMEGTGTNFRQSEETFKKFWKEVGDATGTRWAVRTSLKNLEATKQNEGQKWAEPTMGILTFEVESL